MLSREDNELLCRIGPGTPMGTLMRQYWIPAALSSELPEPDGAPVRIRLLGENLIAFRVSSGAVGLVQNQCPHRGTSLFYGRNEDDGLRCVYHGWKFDVRGRCVDMPSEPAASDFKHKVRALAYPCVERGGLVWAYLGPRSTPPRGVAQVGRQTVGPVETLPNTSDWYGRFRALANKDNDYLVDRKEQKTASFTGIGSIFLQDQAATESMGAIYDRSQEHLGTSVAMIIRTRKRLLDAARALRDNGSAFGRRRAAARLVDGGASNGSSKPPFGGSGCPGRAGG